mmetsp:Transcript_33067/g.57939  ORF Transcript_33067/g.57939 Transcript_33067/m.57939 type:complete len:156 (+) Transcript_33067:137-604(+)
MTMERSMSICCWPKCFKPAVREKDDSEWMEPINKKNKRHFSKIEKGSTERRASSVSVKGETSRPSLVDKKEPSVRWADLVGNLNELDITDLDDPKHDMEVFESFNYSFHESDDKTDSGPHESMGQGQNSMGRISMGSWFSEDSVIRGLGVSLLNH